MSQVADVELRPASPRRLLAPPVALFVAAAIAVVLLATASSEPLPNRLSGTSQESTQAVEAHVVPRGAGHYWLGRGGAVPDLRASDARSVTR
jgi:hypothetical protein